MVGSKRNAVAISFSPSRERRASAYLRLGVAARSAGDSQMANHGLNCPCILKERPMCREGSRCWHFGNNSGTCDHCHKTGSVIAKRSE